MKKEFYEEQSYKLCDVSHQIELVMLTMDLSESNGSLSLTLSNGNLGKLYEVLRIANENLNDVINAVCPEN